MAVSNVTGRKEHRTGSEVAQLREQFNALATALDALLAKMDTDFADVANASTDYQSTINDGTWNTVNA